MPAINMSLPTNGRRRFNRLDEGRIAYRAEWLTVREHWVERDGVPGTYTVIERPDSVVIVPLTPTGRTILLKQFRFPTNQSSWEVPMGGINAGETAEAAAHRELREEVGLCATDLVPIGRYRPAPGLTPQATTVFVARVADEQLDAAVASWVGSEEIEEVSACAPADCARMIADGRVTDGFSLSAFMLLRLWHDLQRDAV